VTFTSVRNRLALPASLCLLSILTFSASSKATIRYVVSLDHPESHLFRVTMTIPDVTAEVIAQMPAWNALYQIRDFSSHVQQVEAFAGSQRAFIEKVDKQTWRIKGTGTIKISYGTYWDEAGPFASQLNAEHAFINPAMILMYVPERRGEAVHLALPDVPAEWAAAGASLKFIDWTGSVRNFGFDATSYDALADTPIEAGKFDMFQLPGIKPGIWVVIHGDKWRKKQVEENLKRICQYELKLMGGAPFERYTFILHVGKGFGDELDSYQRLFRRVPSVYRGARVFSFVECETHPACVAVSRGLHERAIHTRTVVCGGSDKRVRFLHAGAQRNLEQGAVLRGPWRTNYRAGRTFSQSLAERRTIQPGCVAGKVFALQSGGIQRLVLHQRAGARRLARHSNS
jgi:hypothetical protein